MIWPLLQSLSRAKVNLFGVIIAMTLPMTFDSTDRSISQLSFKSKAIKLFFVTLTQFYDAGPWGMYHKTYYDRNLRFP
jgi:hypothetical protein